MNCRVNEVKTDISKLIEKYDKIERCKTYTEIYRTEFNTIEKVYNCIFNIVLFFKKGKTVKIKKRIPIYDRWENGKMNLCPYDNNEYLYPDLKKISKEKFNYEKTIDNILNEVQINISIQHSKKIREESEDEKIMGKNKSIL